LYAELQEKWWLDPKSKVHGSVFTEWISWSIATRKQA
jgi:DNA polymerase phi